MKKEDSLLISVFAKGISIVLLLMMLGPLLPGQSQEQLKIQQVFLIIDGSLKDPDLNKYRLLISLKRGDLYSSRWARQSLKDLYKTGLFKNIEIKMKRLQGNDINLYFVLYKRLRISAIKIQSQLSIAKGPLKDALFSVRENANLSIRALDKSLDEIKAFLKSRGFFNGRVTYRLQKNFAKGEVKVFYIIDRGQLTRLAKVQVQVKGNHHLTKIKQLLSMEEYIPFKFQKQLQKVEKLLRRDKFYFPHIRLDETFLDQNKERVEVTVTIDPGSRYQFIFKGIGNKMGLISSIWEKKRFEAWAENESRAIILRSLTNRGYIDADVRSSIDESGGVKTITFTVVKNRQYTLGDVTFTGNASFSEKRLKEVIQSDNDFFSKVFYLKSESLAVDRELLKYFYHFNGFFQTRVDIVPQFKKNRADIRFDITEGRKITIADIRFSGNRTFTSTQLSAIIQIKAKASFVQQKISEDLERLRQFYYSNGYDDVVIDAEISRGLERSVLLKISEGDTFAMGRLIVVGASNSQEDLLIRLFPLDQGAPFNRSDVERFRMEVENSALFNEIKIDKILRSTGRVDLLVKVIPDRSRYYGFRIGWEERRLGEDFFTELVQGLRGTLEYQERNIFNSYSSLSAIFQISVNRKRRLVVSYDTPYFLLQKIDSSFRIWQEDEAYQYFKYNRFGVEESLVRRITPNSYLFGSLNWYRTQLTELDITPTDIDPLNVPFDTISLNLSYVIEERDDPFNPSTGDYFSSDLKVGLPIFDRHHSFFKFFLRYQKNFRFLNNGVVAFTLRNGFASGEVAITERFFAGDIRTFRGHSNYRLGPYDEATEGQAPTGGNAMLLINLEATFPLLIIPIEDLYYSVFADVGNVFAKTSDFSLSHLEKAIGLSIKYKTPLGPFRIAVAWNMRRGDASSFEFHWGIGNAF
jgi:outer membrane protein insertion porin family